MLRVDVLGPLRVSVDDRVVELPAGRLRALVATLALAGGAPVRADVLAEQLWGDEQPGDPGNALQSLVSRLRRALGVPVTSGPAGYRLEASVDALELRAAAGAGRQALAAGDLDAAADHLRPAVALWRAAPSEVDGAGLDELHLQVVEDLAEVDLAQGRPREVLAALDPLAGQHPLREHLQALHLRALAAADRPADALGAYDRLRARLADELGADPSAELQAVHAQLLSGPVPAAVASNLQPALTSFVGRERELADLLDRVRSERLVTVLGAGGSGKTRLATEVAQVLRDEGGEAVRDGVWLVELAPLTGAAQVPSAVLAALDLRDVQLLRSASPRDAVSRLAQASCVLALDNCEHLVDAVAQFAEQLLRTCPGVRLLATSREPLSVSGEAVFPLAPLPTGDAAVALFVERARAASPRFRLDDTTRDAVLEVCRRLDGLPLALELAAARLRTLTVQQVAARLDDRFRLLTGGSRTAAARHRTLTAVVAWSWDLLDPQEQRLAEGLSVFAGGVTPGAAASVFGLDDPLGALVSLADKSLLQVLPSARDQAEPRFRMLETLREWGVDRLVARGELEALRDRHAAHVLGVAEACAAQLWGPDQLEAAAVLEADRADLAAGLRHAAATGDAVTALRLTAALGWWWSVSGEGEALAWHDLALATPGEAGAARAETAALREVAAIEAGDPDPEAASRAYEGLLGVDTRSAVVLRPWMLVVAARETELAGELAIVHAHPEPWVRATGHLLEAFTAENAGDLQGAREGFGRALVLYREVQERWGLGSVLTSLGDLLEREGDRAGAVVLYEEAALRLAELRAWEELAQVHLRLAVVLGASGEAAAAWEHVARARELSGSRLRGMSAVWADIASAMLLRAAGEREQALRLLGQAGLAVGSPPPLRALLLTVRAHLMLDATDPGAGDVLIDALALGAARYDGPIGAAVAVAIARLVLQRGDRAGARRVLGLAVAMRGGLDRSNLDEQALLAELGDPEVAELGRDVLLEELAQALRR